MKKIYYIWLLIFLSVVTFLILVPPYYIVNPGFLGLHVRLGRIISIASQAGAYGKIPFIDSVITLDNRIIKAEIETTALSHDLQSVSVGMAINYRINDPLKLYEDIGANFESIVIDPFTQESVKAIVAQFTAEDLIQKRHEAKEKVFNDLNARLVPRHILLVDFNFIHLDFSKDFIHAVEEKQIAEQSAKTAKNLTEKVKEEALQLRQKAEAEAYALKVKKESVTKELIQLKQVEIELRAIEKWNGVLPQFTSGSIPFFNFLNNSIK